MRRVVVVVVSLLAGLLASLLASVPARADTDAAGSTLHADYIGSARPDAGHYDRITDRGVPVGRHDGGVTRGLWELSLPALPVGSLILRADLDMHTQSAGGCSQAPFDLYAVPGGFGQQATWNAPPVVDGPVASAQVPYSPGPCAQGSFGFDLTAVVAGSYQGARTTLDVELRAADETDPDAFKYLATDATLVVRYDAPPGQPVVTAIDGAACGNRMPVIAVNQYVQATVSVSDPDDTSLSMTLELYSGNHRTQLARDVLSHVGPSTQSYAITPATPLVTGQVYAVRAVTQDQHLRSVASSWCDFRVDNRVPSTPTQSTTDFGIESPAGYEGVPGTVEVTGGGPETARYELSTSNGFPVGLTCGSHSSAYAAMCTNDGAPVAFSFTPTVRFFQLCVRAVSRAGVPSTAACQFYLVNPPPMPPVSHEWASSGVAAGASSIPDTGAGHRVALQLREVVPTADARLGFTDTSTATAPAVIRFDRAWSALVDVETSTDTPETVLRAGPLTMQVSATEGVEVCLQAACESGGYYFLDQPDQLVLTWAPHTSTLSLYEAGRPFVYATVSAAGLASPADLLFGGDTTAPLVGSIGTTQLYAATLTPDQVSQLGQNW